MALRRFPPPKSEFTAACRGQWRNESQRQSAYNGAMEPSDYILIGAAVVILGFLWNLQREMGGLRERMARLEGTVGLLAKAVLDRTGT